MVPLCHSYHCLKKPFRYSWCLLLRAVWGSWEPPENMRIRFFFNGFGYASEKEVTKHEKMIQNMYICDMCIYIYIYEMTCTWCTLTKRNSKCFPLRTLKRYSSVAAFDLTCQVMRHMKHISKTMRNSKEIMPGCRESQMKLWLFPWKQEQKESSSSSRVKSRHRIIQRRHRTTFIIYPHLKPSQGRTTASWNHQKVLITSPTVCL